MPTFPKKTRRTGQSIAAASSPRPAAPSTRDRTTALAIPSAMFAALTKSVSAAACEVGLGRDTDHPLLEPRRQARSRSRVSAGLDRRGHGCLVARPGIALGLRSRRALHAREQSCIARELAEPEGDRIRISHRDDESLHAILDE